MHKNKSSQGRDVWWREEGCDAEVVDDQSLCLILKKHELGWKIAVQGYCILFFPVWGFSSSNSRLKAKIKTWKDNKQQVKNVPNKAAGISARNKIENIQSWRLQVDASNLMAGQPARQRGAFSSWATVFYSEGFIPAAFTGTWWPDRKTGLLEVFGFESVWDTESNQLTAEWDYKVRTLHGALTAEWKPRRGLDDEDQADLVGWWWKKWSQKNTRADTNMISDYLGGEKCEI